MTDTERHARFLAQIDGYQAALRRLVAVYAKTAADREDLFQEILLQLWRSFDRFRGEATFSTFLYRVALNTALLGRRRIARRPPGDTRHPIEQVAAPASEPGHDGEVEALYAAIQRLRPIDRAVLLLMLEGESHAGIAAVTGLSTGNVGVRLSRARRRLRSLLEPHPRESEEDRCTTKT